jgi:hypothetical protein
MLVLAGPSTCAKRAWPRPRGHAHVEGQVSAPVDRIETEPPHRTRKRVERAVHVERLDDDEDADR